MNRAGSRAERTADSLAQEARRVAGYVEGLEDAINAIDFFKSEVEDDEE